MAAETKRLVGAWLIALTAACGGAAEQDAGDSLSAAAPSVTGAAAVVTWRTCADALDCALRASVCEPLAAGEAKRFCRLPRLEAGAACTGDDTCEPGLACLSVSGGTAHACVRGVTNRKPLSCSPTVFSVDAGCEVLPD